ncbi:MAG: winged helix DNA-binding domain-containing protein [Beutenbergiaceae bacterium]
MPISTFDERTLRLTRLDRQGLRQRQDAEVEQVVQRLCALQSQEPVSPFLALWNRIEGFRAQDLEAAYRSGSVVKATMMRMTLHTVAAADYPAFWAAVREGLRRTRMGDRRLSELGLDPAGLDDLTDELRGLLTTARTSADMTALLAERCGNDATAIWWAMRCLLPIHHVPADGATWAFGRRPRFGYSDRGHYDGDEGTKALLLSYLRAFGPAARPDVARFTKLSMTAIRRGLQQLEQAGLVHAVNGPSTPGLVDVTHAPGSSPDQEIPPRLMTMWDSYVMAYADGSVVPTAYRKVVTRINGDQLPTVLVDGKVAGAWRILNGYVEVTAFERLATTTWSALEAEAAALLAFVSERQAQPWARFHHWWDKGIPGEDVRRLG